MTNQEAISVLESINAKTDYFLINDDARAEAIDMAISALQAQDVPDTNVGDTVSRQAAINALCTPHGILYPIRTIEELPSAQPETARRIVGKSRDGMTLWYQCDMCNEPVDKQDVYCRGCGRRFVDE